MYRISDKSSDYRIDSFVYSIRKKKGICCYCFYKHRTSIIMHLQNIRFPEPGICSEEALYYHRDGEWIRFDGYFNLFYIEKWKTYTTLESLTLHIKNHGCQAIRLMHDETILLEQSLENQDGLAEDTAFSFPYKKFEDGVFWFSVKTNEIPSLCGWLEGESSTNWPVRIATVVCTYRREPYVLRNLKSILAFMEKPENQAFNLCYWLVDNGQTLIDNEEIRTLAEKHPDVIKIIPNQNVGGAGGFTRGMMEAIEQKEELELTHVLLMDDDAIFDPELFVRAYGFLSVRRNIYEEIRLGGTLMREDYPYLCQAMGEWFEHFTVQNEHRLADLRSFKTCCSSSIQRSADDKRLYSGWWCCCYSLKTVRKNNLPLQIFIHRDDIEYEVRNRNTGIVFLNGISVWHKGFEVNFLGTNSYYDVRNGLIFAALHEPGIPLPIVGKWICKMILAAVMRLQYEEAHLIMRGVRDFLKGPQWVFSQNPELLHQSVRSELPVSLPTNDSITKITEKMLYEYYSPDRIRGKWFKKITFNGWFLPPEKDPGILLPVDSPLAVFRKKEIHLIDVGNGTERIAHKNWKQFFKAIKMCGVICLQLTRQYRKTESDYRSWRCRMEGIKESEQI